MQRIGQATSARGDVDRKGGFTTHQVNAIAGHQHTANLQGIEAKQTHTSAQVRLILIDLLITMDPRRSL